MLQGEQEDLWPFIASIIYTTAWCTSFYGQIYQNYRLKSVEGFSLNYLAFNILGYSFYTVYSSIGYFTDIGGAGTVVIADLIFVYHSVLMVIIQIYQCCIYQRKQNKISKYTYIIIIALILIVLIQVLIYLVGAIEWYQYWNPITVMGYAKLVITLIKYTPAAYWNYQRKSTEGWSIINILLDLLGGVFSFASGGLSIENGLNLVKVILAFITVAYDILFCIQHYCLYRKKNMANIYVKDEQLADSLIVPSEQNLPS